MAARVARQVDRLQAEILDVRSVQRDAQANLRGAEEAQVEALIGEQREQDRLNRARVEAADARDTIDACVARIGKLQDRLADLIPKPRLPE